MRNIFKRKPAAVPDTVKGYLFTYDVYNKVHSLVKPVSTGSFNLESTGPANLIPSLESMAAFATQRIKDALDTATIGAHNDLSPDDLVPDNFTIVFRSITRIN